MWPRTRPHASTRSLRCNMSDVRQRRKPDETKPSEAPSTSTVQPAPSTAIDKTCAKSVTRAQAMAAAVVGLVAVLAAALAMRMLYVVFFFMDPALL